MNETLKILKERRSIRSFRPEPVREEDLNLREKSPEHQAGSGAGP